MRKGLPILLGIVLAGCGASQPAQDGYTAKDFAKRPPPAAYAAQHSGATGPTTAPLAGGR